MGEERLLFTADEWQAAVEDAVPKMQAYVGNFVAPISRHLADHAILEGSGTYISLEDRIFILTNFHVADARSATQLLIHQLKDQEQLVPIRGNHLAIPLPQDVALLPVDADAWAAAGHNSRAITTGIILPTHYPAPTELLFLMGYAGARHSFRWDTLITPVTTSAAREVPLPSGDPRFDTNYHFGIDYNPGKAVSLGSGPGLPIPNGMSGSLVWNTRLVECKLKGISWTPAEARVTGLVWGWPSQVGCLVATRAECLSAVLADAANTIRIGGLDNPSVQGVGLSLCAEGPHHPDQ